MKYRIGEVSKILSIPIDTLRYLESQHIVSPEKDDTNHYRCYDAWDINYLTEYKKYRSFDFSVNEVQEILHFDDLNQVVSKFEEKQQYFEKQYKYYMYLKKRNSVLIEKLKSIPEQLNQFKEVARPESYCLKHRRNETYQMKEEFQGLLEKWMSYFAFVDPIIEMKKEDIMDRDNSNNFEWGFGILKDYIDIFTIPVNETVVEVGQRDCLYTIISAGNRGSFSLKLLDSALEYMKSNGYALDGHVYGNLLARTHEKEGYHRYIEVWIPIKKYQS